MMSIPMVDKGHEECDVSGVEVSGLNDIKGLG